MESTIPGGDKRTHHKLEDIQMKGNAITNLKQDHLFHQLVHLLEDSCQLASVLQRTLQRLQVGLETVPLSLHIWRTARGDTEVATHKQDTDYRNTDMPIRYLTTHTHDISYKCVRMPYDP